MLSGFFLVLDLHNQVLLNLTFPQLQMLVSQDSVLSLVDCSLHTALLIPVKTRFFIATVGVTFPAQVPSPNLIPSFSRPLHF